MSTDLCEMEKHPRERDKPLFLKLREKYVRQAHLLTTQVCPELLAKLRGPDPHYITVKHDGMCSKISRCEDGMFLAPALTSRDKGVSSL